jgi:hypothetical protein
MKSKSPAGRRWLRRAMGSVVEVRWGKEKPAATPISRIG